MFKNLFTVIIFMMSVQTYAGGDRVGNGGDVLVCGGKLELLDIYEARLSGYKIKKPAGRNYNEMLQNFLKDKLSLIQPVRYNKYLLDAGNFQNEASFLPGIKLNDVDDSGMVAIPHGCKLEQIAIQLSDNDRPPGKKRYTVSLDLWNKLDEFNKMTLILHEIIYREAIEKSSSNSMVVRAMLGELIREDLQLKDYLMMSWALSRGMELKKFSMEGLTLEPEILFYKNEYNEDVFEIRSKVSFYVRGNGTRPYTEFSFRLKDDVILKGVERSVLISYLIRPNTDFLLEKVIFRPSQETSYHDGRFFSRIPFDLGVKFLDISINPLVFEKVKEMNVLSLQSSYGYKFSGFFSFEYDGLSFTPEKKNMVGINRLGEVVEYELNSGTGIRTNVGGIFDCDYYKIDKFRSEPAYDIYSYKKCSSESSFLKINFSKAFEASPLNDVNELLHTGKGYFISNFDFKITQKTNIGKDYESGEDIFLEKGTYHYQYNAESSEMAIVDSSGGVYELYFGMIRRYSAK